MAGYDESTYGERIAGTYDTRPEIPTDTDDTVAFLAEVAGKGPVLELGIGTGRIALPLASRGLQVTGIDASPAMVGKLRQKPGGSHIPVSRETSPTSRWKAGSRSYTSSSTPSLGCSRKKTRSDALPTWRLGLSGPVSS